MTEGVGVREEKIFSKLIVMMAVKSKLDKNSGLIVPAKCMPVEIATLISVKRRVKVILEKSTGSLYEHMLLSLKGMIL